MSGKLTSSRIEYEILDVILQKQRGSQGISLLQHEDTREVVCIPGPMLPKLL